MTLFICEKCNRKKNILKQTLIFIEKKIRAKESKCVCGNYMKDTTKYKGFGTSFKAPNDKSK
tara:strand:- start:480 stop:665 length:186 start_codon:yes stop_codon:yes gene_type:complete